MLQSRWYNPSRDRADRGRQARSGATRSPAASARAGWAPCTWPSGRGRGARWRSRSCCPSRRSERGVQAPLRARVALRERARPPEHRARARVRRGERRGLHGHGLRRRAAISRRSSPGGALSPARTIAILEQVASALDAVHATGLYHRDVKPANVARGRRRGDRRAALPPHRLRPEQAPLPGQQPAHERRLLRRHAASTWPPSRSSRRTSTIAWTCTRSGACSTSASPASRPFRRPREEQVLYAHIQDPPPKVTELRPDLPAAIDDVVAKALAKDPEERYASCGELRGGGARGAPAASCDGAGRAVGRPRPAAAATARDRAGTPRAPRSRSTDEFLIGREAPDEGTLGQDAEISRQHARITRAGRRLRDRGPRLDERDLPQRPPDHRARDPVRRRPDPGGRHDAGRAGERAAAGVRRTAAAPPRAPDADPRLGARCRSRPRTGSAGRGLPPVAPARRRPGGRRGQARCSTRNRIR